jgi:hypothetical protein
VLARARGEEGPGRKTRRDRPGARPTGAAGRVHAVLADHDDPGPDGRRDRVPLGARIRGRGGHRVLFGALCDGLCDVNNSQ